MERHSVSIYTADEWNTHWLSVKSYFTISINNIFTGSISERKHRQVEFLSARANFLRPRKKIPIHLRRFRAVGY